MPYDTDKPADMKSMKDKLSKTYSAVDDTAVRQAIHIWNGVMESSNDEGRAWASVYAAMNKRGLPKAKKANLASRVAYRYLKAIALAEGLDVPRPLVQKAEKAIQAEVDALKAVEDAYNHWLAVRKKDSGLDAIREYLDAHYDRDEWRDTVYSDFDHATWYGLNVRDFQGPMREAAGALNTSYKAAQNILAVLKAMK